MKTNAQSIANHRDIIKRKKRLKKELKLTILKSLTQNLKNKPLNRMFFTLKLLLVWKKNISLNNQQNICVYSGKKKTTFKITSLSRQFTKRFIEQGLIQSIKSK